MAKLKGMAKESLKREFGKDFPDGASINVGNVSLDKNDIKWEDTDCGAGPVLARLTDHRITGRAELSVVPQEGQMTAHVYIKKGQLFDFNKPVNLGRPTTRPDLPPLNIYLNSNCQAYSFPGRFKPTVLKSKKGDVARLQNIEYSGNFTLTCDFTRNVTATGGYDHSARKLTKSGQWVVTGFVEYKIQF